MCNKLVFLTFIVFIGKVSAQNINGDTVYVSTETQTWLTFYSAPNGQVTKDATDFSVAGTGKSIAIQPLKSNTRATTLMIQEGPRTHQFLVLYKDDLNPLELSYDYTDLKKMAQKVKDREARKETVVKATPEVKKTTDTKSSSSTAVNQESINLALAISAGDDAFDKGKYIEAKEAYQKAISIRPNNDYSKTKIAAIDKLIAEKERLAKKLQDENYNNSLLKAAKAFTAKNYNEARTAYSEALESRPNDVFATNQITAIDKMIADEAVKAKQDEARRQQEETYATTIANADKALIAQDFETAKSYYSLASSYKPNDPYPKKKLEETLNKINALSKQKEDQEKEATYHLTLSKAKAAFDAGNYEMSKDIYNEALTVRPQDLFVKNQVKAIDKAIALQAKKDEDERRSAQAESGFNDAMTLGDNAFKAENYDVAKNEYNKALKLKKDARAENQLREINKILDDQKQKAIDAQQQQMKEVARNQNYSAAIKTAENFYNNKDYVNARIAYKQALNYKDEQEPKTKIAELEILLAQSDAANKAIKEKEATDNELNKKFAAALTKAKNLEAGNDFVNAKVAYLEALQLKPDEITPKSRIEAIDKKVLELENNKKYEEVVAKGNIAIGNRDYTGALASFREALALKPLETYPLKQINYLDGLIKNETLAANQTKEKEEEKAGEQQRIKNFNDGMAAYKRGETALNERRWEDALNEYSDFLALIPDTKELNNYQYNAQGSIDFAKRKIVDLKNYLTRLKGSTFQAEAIPYTTDELKTKFPTLTFNIPTPDQISNLPDSIKEISKTSKLVMAETGNLNLSDSANSVKMSLQGIAKKGNNLYFRIRFENSGTDDLVTAPLDVYTAKKNKKAASLTPLFVSATPVVMPGKAFNIVYVSKNITVADADTVELAMTDRMKKGTLTVTIPGSVFNQEKSK